MSQYHPIGGNVRAAQILGDRILTKKLMGKEGARHIVGRYVQILYDGYPEMHVKVTNNGYNLDKRRGY